MPKLRDDNSLKETVGDLSMIVGNWLRDINPSDIWQNCSSCRHLDADDRTCKRHNAKPPVKVILVGCNQYEDAYQIPF